MSDIEDLKIPLIVGVSGHIDIAEPEEAFEKPLKEFWTLLRERVGSETPIILLSSLAVGADRLAAKYRPADVKLCAVLPFERQAYEKDFSGEELDAFRAFMADSFKCITCPGAPGDYAAGSDYIRSRADVMLTFWDGWESLDSSGKAKRGGTWFLVRKVFNLDGKLLPEPEKAHLVVNFPVTRKSSHSDKEKQVFQGKNWGTLSFDPDSRQWQQLPGVPEQKNEFFRNIKNIREHNASLKSGEGERNYLFAMLSGTPQSFKIVEKDFLRYEYLDRVAVKNQSAHRKEFLWIAIMSVIAGITGQMWGDLTFSADEKIHELVVHCVILFYFLSCIFTWLFFRCVNGKAHYEKYVTPRVVAELMRLKIFWRLAGIKEDFFTGLLKDCANYWVALPVCNWEAADPVPEKETAGVPDFAMVKSAWMEDQRNFYRSYILPDPGCFFKPQPGENLPAVKSFRTLRTFMRKYFKPYSRLQGYFTVLKNLFFWGGFSMASGLIVVYLLSEFDLIPGGASHTEFLDLARYREFMVGLCPFVVATLGWLLEKKQWGFLEKRYREHWALFERACKQMEQLPGTEEKQLLIRELMQVCHSENTDWENVKRDTPPEPML